MDLDHIVQRTVGLTGGIASGKSTVAAILRHNGALVVDADQVCRDLMLPGHPVFDQIVQRFGQTILDQTGQINRAALGRLIFAHPQAKADLEALLWPCIREQSLSLLAHGQGWPKVYEAALLVESGYYRAFAALVVVDLPPKEQIRRLRERNGLSHAEAQARLDAQISRDRRLAAADFVIDNSRSLEETRKQCLLALREIKALLAAREGTP